MKRKILLITIITISCLVFPGIILSLNVTITQLDSSGLLTSSKVDCYVSITDDQGEPVENADSSLINIEHETSKGMVPADILNIERNGLIDENITFLLVLDNSGSMYDAVGRGADGTRMENAVRAVKEFLHSMDNPNIRVGLAIFNTQYKLLLEPANDSGIIKSALKGIEKPETQDAYTELYYAVGRAVHDIARYRGRKAIILLSDGENYPYFENSGKPHSEFGETVFTSKEGLDQLRMEGISLYGINFSNEKDPELSSVSIGSGGIMYDALNSDDLSNIYGKIQKRIENEYKVTLRAPVVFLENPKVRAVYRGTDDTKSYYTRSLMGQQGDRSLHLLLIILFLALLLWIVLVILRFEKAPLQAEISMLPSGMGKAASRTIALTEQRTIIGSSPASDFTVAGVPGLDESHAAIVQDKNGLFTVIADNEIRVNNKLTKKRRLKPGDVINIEGATIVFDEPGKE